MAPNHTAPYGHLIDLCMEVFLDNCQEFYCDCCNEKTELDDVVAFMRQARRKDFHPLCIRCMRQMVAWAKTGSATEGLADEH